jgi:hypothetical protein
LESVLLRQWRALAALGQSSIAEALGKACDKVEDLLEVNQRQKLRLGIAEEVIIGIQAERDKMTAIQRDLERHINKLEELLKYDTKVERPP